MFAKQIKAFVDKTIKGDECTINKIRRDAAFVLFARITISTAVDKGILRGNWVCTLERPFSGEVMNPPTDRQTVINRMKTVTMGAKLGDDIWYSNNLPYAVPIMQEGWSAQTPKGTFDQHMAAWPQIVEASRKKYGG
ncbi:hypothetical protein [Vibrio phage VpKK5]|uniref:tail completion or Neck1 protein n=1 Tax=Vibrio phage VpKK5 TaxID=1538804 RepID=UPI0004F5AE86|nr:tail completion or Neck1 protein [Vibrio phage VpKK5]AIM40553.1 hypothetical protein [Vibrio phage VpKK5]